MIPRTMAVSMDTIVNLCKRRGLIFPSSEIYGGLRSTWDYGPVGVELKRNVKNAWWRHMIQRRNDVVGLDAAILMAPRTWEASGHVATFSDPLVECLKWHQRFRADHLPAFHGPQSGHEGGPEGETVDMAKGPRCPNCGNDKFTDARNFNLMFKTYMGPVEDDTAVVWLRPETAQGIFVNFQNVQTTTRKKIPFGIAQVGKSFRNEITPGNFVYRTREFEQMEMAFFCKPGKDELSHYSKRTVDIEYAFPFTEWGELEGIANRTDFDLKQHSEFSGQDLSYFDQETNERFVPYVIAPAAGAEHSGRA